MIVFLFFVSILVQIRINFLPSQLVSFIQTQIDLSAKFQNYTELYLITNVIYVI